MKLPRICVPVTPLLLTTMPCRVLPAITLASLGALPPIEISETLTMIPSPALP